MRFCLIDDVYMLFNLYGARRYESIKRFSDSDVRRVRKLRGFLELLQWEILPRS